MLTNFAWRLTCNDFHEQYVDEWDNLGLKMFEIGHSVFWFNVFNICRHSSSNVLFPLIIKRKEYFSKFFSLSLSPPPPIWQISSMNYLNSFYSLCASLKERKGAGGHNAACMCVSSFFGFGTNYEFSQNLLWILWH